MSRDEEREKEIKEEKESREDEGGPRSASDPSDEIRAAEVVAGVLFGPFDEFNPDQYLREFYPPLDTVLGMEVMAAIQEMEQKAGAEAFVDIRELQRRVSLREGVSPEALENYCIYDFFLRRAIPRILKDRPDDHLRMLDVGGGPTIYQHIPFLSVADSIVHSEYLPSNRAEVLRWQRGESLFAWDSFFSFVREYFHAHPEIAAAAVQGVRDRFAQFAAQDPQSLENALREKIKEVVPVDVFKENLGFAGEGFDLVNVGREGNVELVTSNFCVESATADRAFWQSGIENVTAKVAPGGFLLMTAITNAEWYEVGEERMPAVPIRAEDLTGELIARNFEILLCAGLTGSNQEKVGYGGMAFVLAKKRER